MISLGGLWDCIFGTRKTGRHPTVSETREDKKMSAETTRKQERLGKCMDHPIFSLMPVGCLILGAAVKYITLGI